jgi:hypothetical protein
MVLGKRGVEPFFSLKRFESPEGKNGGGEVQQ